MASRGSEDLRSYVRRATETGAAQRVREKADRSRADTARRLGVDTTTFFRWEKGERVPTHGANLSNYARLLKRLGVDDDPAMKETSDSIRTPRGDDAADADAYC